MKGPPAQIPYLVRRRGYSVGLEAVRAKWKEELSVWWSESWGMGVYSFVFPNRKQGTKGAPVPSSRERATSELRGYQR